MRRRLILAAVLCFLGARSNSFAEDLTGVFVYPSESYSPKCIKFCKANNVKRVYMKYSYLQTGCARIYKEAGINVTLSHFPCKKIWKMEFDKFDEAVKDWGIKNIGKENLDLFDKFEIDEPHLGYGDWNNESLPDVKKDQVFKKLYYKNFGKEPAEKRDIRNPEDWRKVLALRQSLYWKRLKHITSALKKNYPSKGIELTITPCGYESGPALGIDINLLNESLPDDINVLTDPYFQAFRRPLQWSGMIINWLRCASNNRKIGGAIQYYDVIKDSGWPSEGYMPLELDDVNRQAFEYLMNGACDIVAFTLGSRIFPDKPEYEKHLGKILSFVQKSRKYWENTISNSQIGIYFSENTFRMLDMWGPWSRMTGLYGASFQTEWTYYALSVRHLPANIISIPFNDEKGLMEKLAKYKAVALSNVKCMSQYEAECFKKYVSNGGNLIVSGETSFYDQNGVVLKKASLSDLLGIESASRSNEKKIKFLKNKLIPDMEGKEITIEGNAADLFKREAQKHPGWLKEKCVKMKFDGYDMKFAEKLPETFSLKIKPLSDTKIIAEYSDGSAAITLNKFGEGQCIYIAPSDLMLFKGIVNDSLEENAATKANLDFMEKLFSACLGKRTFEISGAEGVETACRKSVDGQKIYIYMLNHSEKPAKNIKLKLPDNSINEMTVFDQETCSTKKIKAIRSSGDPVFEIPAFKYGTIAMFILN